MFQLILCSLGSMFRQRLRALLTVGGIGIGVLSVVVIALIGELGQGILDSTLERMGMNGVIITDKNQSLDEYALNTVSKLPEVQEAMPLISLMTRHKLLGESYSSMLWGVDQNANQVISLDLVTGRLINKGDLAAKSDVCVIDKTIALETFGTCQIIGKTIEVNTGNGYTPLKIIGVVENGVNILQSMTSGALPNFIYMPYTTLMDYSKDYTFSTIVTRINEGDADTEALIKRSLIMEQKGYLPSVQNLLQQKGQLTDILGLVTTILAAIGGISLLVAGLSIMTVMLTAVEERRREIGIKKSIGATKGHIMVEFLFQSLVITLFGAVSGITLGLAAVWVGCLIAGIAFQVSFGLLGGVMGFTLTVGLIFGVYPALRAADLSPVEALK